MAVSEIETSNSIKIIEVDGQKLVISLCETDFNIKVYEAAWAEEHEEYEEGTSVGGIDLKEIDNGNYYITWMGLEGCGGRYLHKGLGRAALKFFKDYFGGKIYAADHDGQTRDDGSHLTNDAPIFIGKMREEGIVENSEEDSLR